MRATQEAVLAEMRRWGYRYVVTPSLENLDALALGLEARPPFPKGYVLEQGDWSLLDAVRKRAPFWRKVPR